MRTPTGLRIDSPSWPLLQAHISYWGITDAAGNAFGTTVACGNLANEPSYQGLGVKLLDGDAAGQVQPILIHPAGTNTLTVAAPFTDNAGAVVQVVAGTRFVILSTAGGGGAPAPVLAPSIGLWMFGECDPAMVASDVTIVCPNLAGFPDDIFNNEFWMQVIHNFDAVGAAPEREIRRITNYVGTGTFTVDAFTADVEAGDLVAIFHESIMGIEILGFGTLTLSSATVPEDNLRPEVNNYFRGCLLMVTEGAVRFQPRRILESTIGTGAAGTGIFTLDPNNPFTGVPGLADYIIIGGQTEFIPGVDGVNNRTPSDVIGGKADTAVYVPDNVSSVIRYLKGLLNRITDIWTIVLGLLVTTETGGTVNTAVLGTEYDVYVNESPAGVFEPLKVMIDFSNQDVAETVVVRVYYRIRPLPANKILKDQVAFEGVQGLPLKNIELEPNRYGIRVSIQRNAGIAQNYDWEVIYRA